MSTTAQASRPRDLLAAYFWSGNTLRSRSVGDVVLSAVVDLPPPSARLLADWKREATLRLQLEPGDVEALSLVRACARWPDYSQYLKAAGDSTASQGLPDVLATANDVSLMACRGARYHHDGAQYGGAVFCNLFLSEDKGLDVHFASAGVRIPLTRGTLLIFDTGQPHAVIPRGNSGFDAADFKAGADDTQVFLTWELPVENPPLASALGIAFDVDVSTASQLDQQQVWVNGAAGTLCQASGRWRTLG